MLHILTLMFPLPDTVTWVSFGVAGVSGNGAGPKKGEDLLWKFVLIVKGSRLEWGSLA